MAIEKMPVEVEDAPKTRQERKVHILEAAVRIVSRDGFEGATTRTIAEEAGVNIAMLNYYFGGKEPLLNEMLAHSADKVLQGLSVSLNHSGTIGEVLRAGFESLWAAILRYPEQLPYNMVMRSNYDVEARRLSQKLYTDYRSMLVERLRETLARSGEELSVSLEDFARLIVNGYNGITLDYYISQDEAASERQQKLLLQTLLTLVRK